MAKVIDYSFGKQTEIDHRKARKIIRKSIQAMRVAAFKKNVSVQHMKDYYKAMNNHGRFGGCKLH